jgi:hypothetical protein
VFNVALDIFREEGGQVVDLSGDFEDYEEDNVVSEKSSKVNY